MLNAAKFDSYIHRIIFLNTELMVAERILIPTNTLIVTIAYPASVSAEYPEAPSVAIVVTVK